LWLHKKIASLLLLLCSLAVVSRGPALESIFMIPEAQNIQQSLGETATMARDEKLKRSVKW
jgi:hypothetical protein